MAGKAAGKEAGETNGDEDHHQATNVTNATKQDIGPVTVQIDVDDRAVENEVASVKATVIKKSGASTAEVMDTSSETVHVERAEKEPTEEVEAEVDQTAFLEAETAMTTLIEEAWVAAMEKAAAQDDSGAIEVANDHFLMIAPGPMTAEAVEVVEETAVPDGTSQLERMPTTERGVDPTSGVSSPMKEAEEAGTCRHDNPMAITEDMIEVRALTTTAIPTEATEITMTETARVALAQTVRAFPGAETIDNLGRLYRGIRATETRRDRTATEEVRDRLLRRMAKTTRRMMTTTRTDFMMMRETLLIIVMTKRTMRAQEMHLMTIIKKLMTELIIPRKKSRRNDHNI